MKVRYLVSNHLCCINPDGFIYKRGDIINLQDDLAKKYIDYNIVEPFSYSITDDEIKRLYEDFNETNVFESKVNIFIEAYSKANKRILLDDGNIIEFKVIPETRNEWYYFNTQMSKLYKSEVTECSFEKLKDDFLRLQSEYPHLNALREMELNGIKKATTDDSPKGIAYWYREAIYKRIPEDEKKRAFLSRELEYGLEIYLQGIAIAEYEEFLKSDFQKNSKNKDKKVRTKLFSEYLQTHNRRILAEKLKIEFSTEIGMNIRRMLEVLKDKGLLSMAEGQKMEIYESLEGYFARYIGTYNSIFARNPGISKREKSKKASIEKRIDFLLVN
jgi:hypothetical protein